MDAYLPTETAFRKDLAMPRTWRVLRRANRPIPMLIAALVLIAAEAYGVARGCWLSQRHGDAAWAWHDTMAGSAFLLALVSLLIQIVRSGPQPPELRLRGVCYACGRSRRDDVSRCWHCGEDLGAQDRRRCAVMHLMRRRASFRALSRCEGRHLHKLSALHAPLVMGVLLFHPQLGAALAEHPLAICLIQLPFVGYSLACIRVARPSFQRRLAALEGRCLGCRTPLEAADAHREWCQTCGASLVLQRLNAERNGTAALRNVTPGKNQSADVCGIV